MHSDQHIDLQWRDGDVPVSTQFDDPYFSLEDELAETRHVFLAGNRLPERFRPGFRIAELGFGSGLNLLAAAHLWRESSQTRVLHHTSFEAFPMPPDAMNRAQAGFEVLAAMARECAPFWHRGFLDGFSLKKNPEIWQDNLLVAVGKHSARQATLATYTAAGLVRRSLVAAGFTAASASIFGRKRHMINAFRAAPL